jgi:hypothetical protein
VQLVQERLQTFVWLSTGRLAPRAGMDACRKERVERAHAYALTSMFTRGLEADRVARS